MRFVTRKRRQPPAIIIVSLIDILIVLLIFMMATTTFKNRPMIKIALPESKQAVKAATTESLVITVNKQDAKGGQFFWKTKPVTLEQLRQGLRAEALKSAKAPVRIFADEASVLGSNLQAYDAAKAAGFEDVKWVIRESGK